MVERTRHLWKNFHMDNFLKSHYLRKFIKIRTQNKKERRQLNFQSNLSKIYFIHNSWYFVPRVDSYL